MTTLEIIAVAWLTCSLIVAVVNMCRMRNKNGEKIYVSFEDDELILLVYLAMVVFSPICIAAEFAFYASKKHIGGKR